VNDWELIEELLRVGVLKSSLSSIPACTFKIETMDVNTLLWWSNGLTFDSSVIALNDFLNDIGGVLDGIKSPGLLDSGNFCFMAVRKPCGLKKPVSQ